MIKWFRSRVRYNRPKTIRVLPSGEVQRKYLRNGKTVLWETVDCFTLSRTEQPRPCSRDYKARLLRTAY